jgi:hypothetical protein
MLGHYGTTGLMDFLGLFTEVRGRRILRTSQSPVNAKFVVAVAYKPMVTSWVRSWRGLRNLQSSLTARLKSPEDEAGTRQARPHSLTTTIRSGLSKLRWHDTRRRRHPASTTTHALMPAMLHEPATANFRERPF